MKYEELKKLLTGKKTRKKPFHLESAIQQSCVLWFRAKYPEYIIMSIPNGGSRNKIEAANLRREGALAGASDLVVIATKAVLFVEIKRKNGRQQASQKLFQQNVERLGHEYKICRSLKNFQLSIERWIKEITRVQ